MTVLPFTPLALIQLEDRLAELDQANAKVRHWSYVLANGTLMAQRRAKYELPAAEAAVEQARRRVEDAERDLAMIEEAERA